MTEMIEDYLREVGRSLRVDEGRKGRILAELRTHLVEKIADERAASPEDAEEETVRRVLADFGNPRDLALAYGADGPVLKNAAGDVVLRLGKAVGRGARAVGRGSVPVVKWFAISLGALVLLASALTVWAFYEVRPYVEDLVEKNAPYPLYQLSCDDDGCSGDPRGQSFYVYPEAREVRLDVDVRHGWDDEGNGTVLVQLFEPNGVEKYNRTIGLGERTHFHEEPSFAAVGGEWTVRVEFAPDFHGYLNVEVFAMGLPAEALRR